MPNTPIYGLPYPSLGEPPDGPAQLEALAEAVEALIVPIKPVTDLFATGATVTNVQNTSGTTASASYVESLTGGTPCSLTFVAPPSGKVAVKNTCNLVNSGANSAVMSFVIRAGGTIGSGAVVQAADDANANISSDGSSVRATTETIISSLTPGATYNVRQAFRSTAGTSTYASKRLTVSPIWQ